LQKSAPTYAFRRAAFALLLFATLAASLRAGVLSAQSSATQDSFRTVTDEVGRAVRVPVPVRRVVSLAPSLTESVYALGLDDLLVGDTDYCDYPPAATKKHKVGGAINPNLEEIALLKPDVVLVIKSLNRPETVQQLERLGIPAYSADPHTLADIRASVRHLADVLGYPAAGESLDDSLLQKERQLQQRLQHFSPARVLFVVWIDPLQSVGQHTFIADALAHAGAVSVVESSQDWPRISLEEMVRLQPDFLVFADSHSEKTVNDIESLSKRPGWELLDAVKNRKFAIVSDAVNRPAPRLFAAVEDLARQLHPEAFVEKSESTTASPKDKN
jgi:iron complex transport system substrate-binding protein